MAKKIAPAPEKQIAGKPNKQLLDAIVAVKRLQAYIEGHGGLEEALGEVAKVQELTALTGGFDSLKQALEAVGKEA
jgi:hypothetical protein